MTTAELKKYCNFVLITLGPNAGKMKVTAKTPAGDRIREQIGKGMYRDEVLKIKEELISEHEALKSASETRKAKINAIEGLVELRNAIEDEFRYREELNAMMEDENNDGANPPNLPTACVSALEAKYPRAAAYIKAESYECAAHDVKSYAGKIAMDKIINGEDYVEAISEMEEKWSNYCTEHMFD